MPLNYRRAYRLINNFKVLPNLLGPKHEQYLMNTQLTDDFQVYR
jgi:hypothetical protein